MKSRELNSEKSLSNPFNLPHLMRHTTKLYKNRKISYKQLFWIFVLSIFNFQKCNQKLFLYF